MTERDNAVDLSTFERRRYTEAMTPLTPLRTLSDHLGGPQIYLKRDDQLGLCGGGNKTRKLEFLVADALKAGADTIVATGYAQSNFCRLLAAASAREGLRCVLLLEREHPGSTDDVAGGNALLCHLLGAEMAPVMEFGALTDEFVAGEVERIGSAGARPYLVPRGGANALGGLGYMVCAHELRQQCRELGIWADLVICPYGTGGTQSGLIAGYWSEDNGPDTRIVGISVHDTDRDEAEAHLHARAQEVLALAGITADLPRDRVVCTTEFVGDGYGIPTRECVEAIRLFAQLEGILLDPVYSGKTAAGLIAMIRDGRLRGTENVILLHSGGLPLLFAHSQAVMELSANPSDDAAPRRWHEKAVNHADSGF